MHPVQRKKPNICCAKPCLLCGLCASMQASQPELLLPENNFRQKMGCQVKQAASNVTRMFAAAQTTEGARIAEATMDIDCVSQASSPVSAAAVN